MEISMIVVIAVYTGTGLTWNHRTLLTNSFQSSFVLCCFHFFDLFYYFNAFARQTQSNFSFASHADFVFDRAIHSFIIIIVSRIWVKIDSLRKRFIYLLLFDRSCWAAVFSSSVPVIFFLFLYVPVHHLVVRRVVVAIAHHLFSLSSQTSFVLFILRFWLNNSQQFYLPCLEWVTCAIERWRKEKFK